MENGSFGISNGKLLQPWGHKKIYKTKENINNISISQGVYTHA